MKKKRIIILVSSLLLGATVLSLAIPFSILGIRTANLAKDWAYLKEDASFGEKAEVKELSLVTQHVSCGYATIEMLSSFYGKKVSEDDLEKKNASIDVFFLGLLKRSECVHPISFVLDAFLSEQ